MYLNQTPNINAGDRFRVAMGIELSLFLRDQRVSLKIGLGEMPEKVISKQKVARQSPRGVGIILIRSTEVDFSKF